MAQWLLDVLSDADSHPIGDLDLDGRVLLPDLRDLPEDPAGRHDLVADLERRLKVLNLLLPAPHREEHQQVEDQQHQGERKDLHQEAGLRLARLGHRDDK